MQKQKWILFIILGSIFSAKVQASPLQNFINDYYGYIGIKDAYTMVLNSIEPTIRNCSYPLPNLTDDEKVSVALYTDRMFHDLNPILRTNDSTQIQKFEIYISALDSALTKLPKYNGRVFRATNLPTAVLENYVPEKEVFDSAYLSTSSDSQWLENVVQFKPEQPVEEALFIESKNGVRVDCLSFHPNEEEILFPRATKFVVRSRKTSRIKGALSDSIFIVMREK